MIRRFLRSTIQNATVTHSDSVAARVDPILLRAADILPFEEVEIVDVATGARFSTFVEAAAEGSGEVHVHQVRAGDVVGILSWGLLHDGQTLAHRVKLVTVDGRNQLVALVES